MRERTQEERREAAEKVATAMRFDSAKDVAIDLQAELTRCEELLREALDMTIADEKSAAIYDRIDAFLAAKR